jgi:alpha-maltose-1-phosphate synthase
MSEKTESLKVALFAGPRAYSVPFANEIARYCNLTFFFSGREYARDLPLLDYLLPSVKKRSVTTYRRRDLRNLRAYFSISKELRSYDIIHVQITNVWLYLYRLLYRKVPIVCTIHDPYQHYGLGAFKYICEEASQRLSTRLALRFFVHGEALKTDLSEGFGVPAHKIEVIPHGEFSFYVHLRSSTNLWRKQKSFKRVLFFGEVRRNKGLEYLLKAEPIISESYEEYKICIAGKFEGDLDYYKGLIRNSDKCEIVDEWVPNEQVANLVESSDIIVLPYVSGTQSGVLSLAMAFGKPVVATDVGSIGEVIKDGKNGVLVPPRDEKSLARAILVLLKNEEKRIAMAKEASATAKVQLSWDEVRKKTIAIYEEIGRNGQRSQVVTQ